jgi:energy-coupling factor transporter ATP-binding protein EcfA2
MTTEADALKGILEWVSAGPEWQSDALRRLVTDGSVDESGIAELVAICKGVSPAELLTAEHIGAFAGSDSEVSLRAIRGVQHVNALASDQTLSFRPKGLTIVYGDNGSGKSGYARILKQVCRARTSGRVEQVTPNIYGTQEGVPTAKIEYVVDGRKQAIDWQRNRSGSTELSSVCVFDSHTASVHVDEANGVAYTPYPLRLLGDLANLCRQVKDELNSEIEHLRSQTPASISKPPSGDSTKVGQFLKQLSAETSPEALATLVTFTTEEEERHARLSGDLAGDASRVTRQLETLKAKAQEQLDRLRSLFASVGVDSVSCLRQAAAEAESARLVAEVASDTLFTGEPLQSIRSDTWKALWESARAFSVEEAYPDCSFPVTGPDAVCVLCQQELTPIAAERLLNFEAFVCDDSQKRAASARARYDEARVSFNDCGMSKEDIEAIVATIRDDLHQDSLAVEVMQAAKEAVSRHLAIARDHVNPEAVQGEDDLSWPSCALEEQITELDKRRAALEAREDSPEYAALVAELRELDSRRWLKGVEVDVLAQVQRLKLISANELALSTTTTNRISIKSTEIARTLVTDLLRTQFAREVAGFGVTDLEVELLQQGTERGSPRFKVVFARKPDASVGQVLSEGEYRCVALAAFMAELVTSGGNSGIVFDDPVSSLDHRHREAVAKRLAAEAAVRQVVVFTHDLAFLVDLRDAAQSARPRVELHLAEVTRGRSNAGICKDGPPFNARKIPEITRGQSKRLEDTRRYHDLGNVDEWRNAVESIVTSVRKTWEDAVEEVVRCVTYRLSPKIKTNGLVRLTAITTKDCEVMRDAFGRCSQLLHSVSREANRPLPTPDSVAAEINALETWYTDLQQRQNAIVLP